MRKDRSTLSNLARIRRVHPYHYIDVLDRVLDRGIVIEAWRRISLVGIDLITTRRRFVSSSKPQRSTSIAVSNAVRISSSVNSSTDRSISMARSS